MFESAPLAVPVYTPNVATFLPNTAGIYADFTTEGSTYPLYYLNGTSYASFAAWLTAISGTFTRASTAYRTNASGNLESVSSGVIRFDYDPLGLFNKGLLLEGSSTNLALQSNTFSNASWNGGTTVSVAQNVTGPDGAANSAWTITDTAANTQHGLFQNPSESASTPYTHSLYVKYTNHQYIFTRNEGNYATYDLINGIVTNVQTGSTNDTATITPIGNGWFRITHSWTTTTGGVNSIFFGFANSSAYSGATYAGSGSDTFLAWGFQMEAQSFASSYIPTTTATVTRAADSLTATPISSWYNATNGVLYAQSDTPFSTNQGILEVSDGTLNNYAELRAPTSALGQFLCAVTSGGGNSFIPLATDAGQYTYFSNTSSRAAVSFAANNFSYVKDAGAADSSASGAMPLSQSKLSIGFGAAGLVNGHISQIGYWPNTATVAQLQGLTSPPGWVPTAIAGANPTLYADFAFGGYWYNGWSYPSLASWEAALGATFSRSSTAYFTNGNGLLQQASSNVLRSDFDPVTLASKGVLLEGASTNILLQSNSFTNVAWGNTGSLTLTSGAATGPDGVAASATQFAETTSNAKHDWGQNEATGASATVTSSIWLAANGVQYVSVYAGDQLGNGAYAVFDLVNGNIAHSATLTGSGSSAASAAINGPWTVAGKNFYRCSVTVTQGAGTASYLIFSSASAANPSVDTFGRQTYAGNAANSFLGYGGQVEQLPFASSYIPTAGTTMQRVADNFGAITNQTGSPPWTLFADATGEGIPAVGSLFPSSISDNTTTNYADTFRIGAGVNGINCDSETANTQVEGLFDNVDVAAAFTRYKGANRVQTSNYAFTINGQTPFTTNLGSGGAPASSLPYLQFGAFAPSRLDLVHFGWLRQYGLWSAVAASNAQLQTLTT